MAILSKALKPVHFVHVARVVALGSGLALGIGYSADSWEPLQAGIVIWIMAASLLLGAPRQRGSELLGASAIFITFAEFLALAETHEFHVERWLFAVGALLMVFLPIRISWIRGLASASPDATFASLDRRSKQWTAASLLPVSENKLAELRADEAGGTA